ncbi:hypothetical protein Nepgr_029431 [Nepenthes gracilis]|uniref:Translation initiation factor 5A C-terminal domain-containing protein n=1 Tax=Nepenthes gracilis TaxID=150966 RepID=A0AAD3TCG0_NEPGR|nr:hypothetical protein Nepgr_029431 [Nepenthes gracilis]
MYGSYQQHSTQNTKNAGDISKGDYIIIKDRPCQVTEVSTYRAYRRRYPICHFVGTDIFNGRKLEEILPSYYPCDVPQLSFDDYKLDDVTSDDRVILLAKDGTTRNDLGLPTDATLRKKILDGYDNPRGLTVTVASANGEANIIAVKEDGGR